MDQQWSSWSHKEQRLYHKFRSRQKLQCKLDWLEIIQLHIKFTVFYIVLIWKINYCLPPPLGVGDWRPAYPKAHETTHKKTANTATDFIVASLIWMRVLLVKERTKKRNSFNVSVTGYSLSQSPRCSHHS